MILDIPTLHVLPHLMFSTHHKQHSNFKAIEVVPLYGCESELIDHGQMKDSNSSRTYISNLYSNIIFVQFECKVQGRAIRFCMEDLLFCTISPEDYAYK